MADKVFLFAKRLMKQAMSKTYAAPLPHDLAEMGDRNYVRGRSDMTNNHKFSGKAMRMTMRQEQGYEWPKKLAQRNEIFAPEKILSA